MRLSFVFSGGVIFLAVIFLLILNKSINLY